MKRKNHSKCFEKLVRAVLQTDTEFDPMHRIGPTARRAILIDFDDWEKIRRYAELADKLEKP